MMDVVFQPLIGGALIGLAASLLLLTHGRIAGVSGLLAGLMTVHDRDTSCRAAFVAGLVLVGFVAMAMGSTAVVPAQLSWSGIALAGVLVGFGTRLGNGCTSGHGVCGVSRLSPRSLAATSTFVGAGMITVTVMRYFGGGL